MSRSKLVLSNATTFFTGSIEAVFKKAKKHGFQYLEIIPYRWTTTKQILNLEKQYQIEVVGIHLPLWWNKSLKQVIQNYKLNKLMSLMILPFMIMWNFYLGGGENNPSLKIAEALQTKHGRKPYLVVHTNLIPEIKNFNALARKFDVAIENFPGGAAHAQNLINPISIKQNYKTNELNAKIVFDSGHYKITTTKLPNLTNIIDAYKTVKPEILHIGYKSYHILPDKNEYAELKQMLLLHSPEYIVIETNPLVSVNKARQMFEALLQVA